MVGLRESAIYIYKDYLCYYEQRDHHRIKP